MPGVMLDATSPLGWRQSDEGFICLVAREVFKFLGLQWGRVIVLEEHLLLAVLLRNAVKIISVKLPRGRVGLAGRKEMYYLVHLPLDEVL